MEISQIESFIEHYALQYHERIVSKVVASKIKKDFPLVVVSLTNNFGIWHTQGMAIVDYININYPSEEQVLEDDIICKVRRLADDSQYVLAYYAFDSYHNESCWISRTEKLHDK